MEIFFYIYQYKEFIDINMSHLSTAVTIFAHGSKCEWTYSIILIS